MVENIEKDNLQRFLDKVAAAGKGKDKSNVYARAYDIAARSRRKRIAVNISKLEKCANDNETVLVPGKVLGNGTLSKKITICAVEFSEPALAKLKDSGCAIVDVEEILKKDKVRLIV
ncbi:50S ribosomal protein L18e [uncultured archaeon]|nr:50S ribosomal protein L18e [uncultured archaeon]